MSGIIVIKKKGDFGLPQTIKNYKRFKKRIPIILATNTVNHFKKGFERKGRQTNDSMKGWKSRQLRRKGNTLVKSGILQKDIQKKRVKFKSIVVGTTNLTSKYAEIHNRGGKIRITQSMRKFFWAKFKETKKVYWKNLALHKGSSITIPKREFIGESRVLNRKNKLSLQKELDKVFEV